MAVLSTHEHAAAGLVMDERLTRFVEQARQKGIDPATLFLLLESSGWKNKEIAEAIAARELALPLPERAGIGSPRDAFFHLLAFTALYAWAISLVVLLFHFIEFFFPDPAREVNSFTVAAAQGSIRAALATLIVAYPLFLAVWGYLLREVRLYPEKAKSGVRRWLSFLSLFVAAVTIMANVTTVVFYLVEGDLTVRFLLKVGVLLAITGALFFYFALTLASEGEARA